MGRAVLLAGLANLFGRVSGLVREVAFAAIFGAGMTADAYNAAFRIPNLLRELLAEGTLANVYVPIFAETSERDGLKAAWRLANAMLGVLLLILGAATLLFVVAAEPFVYLVASGFGEVEGKVELATWLTRILSPFLMGLSVASLLGGMLNVRGKFFLPALAPSFLNVFVIAACLGADQWEAATGTPAIGAVAVAATVSGFFTAAVQYPALRREGFRFRPRFKRHPELKRVFKFVAAALVSIVVVQFNLLVETQMASRLGDGPVSWLIYGFRLIQLPMGVVASSVAVASLASLSVFLARGDTTRARETLSRALEMNALLVVPSAVGLYLLSDPLIQLIFERGAFTPEDTAATAGILRMYAVAVIGICMYRVLLPTFFALKDPYLPMRLSLVVMAAKIPVAYGLMYTAGMGVEGLPLSHAVTVSFEVVCMVVVLGRRLQGWAQGFWSQQIRICIAAAVMGVAVWFAMPWATGLGVLGVCLLGAVTYGIAASILQVRELTTLRQKVARKLLPPPPGEHS
jgi:putative peptidoglycan lipid II flippase